VKINAKILSDIKNNSYISSILIGNNKTKQLWQI